MTNNELMEIAIIEASKSAEPLSCGCVIAKEGEIIAQAFNSQRLDKNATAHAEIKAIRLAGEKIGEKDLFGCDAFCTTEPCTMCLSALVFAKISTVYFKEPLTDKRIAINSNEFLSYADEGLILKKL